MASSSSGGPRDVPPTLPQNRNSSLVMDLTDSPGPVSIQDSPLVETHYLQVMSPRGGISQTTNPSSLSDQSHAQVSRQSSEAQATARPVFVPYNAINFVRHGPSQTVQNVVDIPVPDSQNESTAQAVGLTANFREVTQSITVREGSIGAQVPLDQSDSRNVRRRRRSSS